MTEGTMSDREYTATEFVVEDTRTQALFADEQFAYVNRRWPDAVWTDCPECRVPMTVTNTNHGPHCFNPECGWWQDGGRS